MRAERQSGEHESLDAVAQVGVEPDALASNGYWSTGRPRLFVAARPELGAPYAKPYVSAGYGQPHWIWMGVDANAIVTLEMAQAYAGVRAATPILDLAFGVRETWSYQKGAIQPRDVVTRGDVLEGPGPRARYTAWEAEVVGALPLPYSALVADVIVVGIPSLRRADTWLYDESYRAVVADAWYVTARFAALARMLREDSLRFGALTEHVFATGRDEGVWRLGPIVSLQLTRHLEAMAGITFVLSSPDALGVALGSYGLAGLRWRWASGEDDPRPPWRGDIIAW